MCLPFSLPVVEVSYYVPILKMALAASIDVKQVKLVKEGKGNRV